jgi:hypothetical protein
MLEEGEMGFPQKKYKKSWVLENNISKKYIPLQRFNKAIDCITF